MSRLQTSKLTGSTLSRDAQVLWQRLIGFGVKRWFSVPQESREWLLIPLLVIEEANQKITEGTIGNFRYDPDKARLIEVCDKRPSSWVLSLIFTQPSSSKLATQRIIRLEVEGY